MPLTLVDHYPPNTVDNACYICGCGQRTVRDPRTGQLRAEHIFDADKNIDFEGFLAVCEQCVREAAHQLGMMDEHEARKITERDLAMHAELDQSRMQISELRAAVASLTAAGYGYGTGANTVELAAEPADGTYLCTACGRPFDTEHGLSIHQSRMHGKVSA